MALKAPKPFKPLNLRGWHIQFCQKLGSWVEGARGGPGPWPWGPANVPGPTVDPYAPDARSGRVGLSGFPSLSARDSSRRFFHATHLNVHWRTIGGFETRAPVCENPIRGRPLCLLHLTMRAWGEDLELRIGPLSIQRLFRRRSVPKHRILCFCQNISG